MYIQPEKIGFLALKHPFRIGLILILTALVCIWGMSKFDVDDSLTELFRSDSKEFHNYEELTNRFPTSEYDVLLVVEGKDLMTHAGLKALQELSLELGFIDGTTGQISLFSAYGLPDDSGVAQPLIPAEIPKGKALEELKKSAQTNHISGGKLISADSTLTLVVLALDRKYVKEHGLQKSLDQIYEAATLALEGTPLKVSLSGAPVMQQEIRNAVERDRFVYNLAGFIIGAAICWFFFGRLSLVIVAISAPIFAIIWTLGILGLLGVKLNLFLNVIVPLVMVIAFSDSMHMVFAIQEKMHKGASREKAIAYALTNIGPACVLTSLTTAVALLSLVFASSAMVRSFGLTAAMASILAFLSVILTVPTLAQLLLKEKWPQEDVQKVSHGMLWLEKISSHWANRFLNWQKIVFLASLVAAIGSLLLFINLPPKYRLADQIPDHEQAVAALHKLDKKLTGASPVHVLIDWPQNTKMYDPSTLEVIAKVHTRVEKQQGMGNVWSLEMLRRWLKEGGQYTPDKLKEYVNNFPKYLTTRFIELPNKAAVVTGRMPDLDASEILPVVNKLDQKLNELRQSHPEFTFRVTGLSAIAARNSAQMIDGMVLNLILTVLVVALLIFVVFKNRLLFSTTSLLPNLLPITAVGAGLYLAGSGMQFASVIALTVAFGLAVDNSIHFLHRLQGKLAQGEALDKGLLKVIQQIGPVLLLTSFVLAIGMGLTIFSGLPSLRLFGGLVAASLLVALFAALASLPAFLMFLGSLLPQKLPEQKNTGNLAVKD